jgi:hypothetical protein
VPSRTPYGLYDGALVVSREGQKSIVPVGVTVAAVAAQDADGNLTSSLSFVVQHEVNMQHDNGEVNVPFATTVAGMRLSPDHVDLQAAGDTGEFDVTFTAGLDLPGLAADAFGLSQPSVTTPTAKQDDPNDPSTASVKVPFTISHAGHA